jgi:Ca2+-binding EF-hand superfamily protein
VRYQPGWKKMIPIFANLKMIKQSMFQQQVFLDSLAKDFCLTVPRLAQMCASNRLFAKDTLWRMMPCVPYDPASRFMGHMIAPSLGDFLWTHQRMQALLNFNAGNPTGHYTLNLDNCCDYAVADRLCLLDRWESAIDSRGQYFDTSKWGNRSHFRNELHRKQPILKDDIASMAEWTMPETGELEFDYVTNRRPRIADKPVSDKLWDKVLISLYDAQATLEVTPLMQVVRRISHNINLTSMHMRKMLGYFKIEEHRAECFVIFFFRIVDICNAKIFSCRFSKQEEVVKLQERLGYVSFFPFLQPENVHFSLDFTYHDQRLCANLLVKLALMEKQENLRNPQVYKADGSPDPDTQKGQFLARWQFFEKMPTQGKFECNYVCAPENRKYEPRRKNAEAYGHYNVRTAEANVQWWTGLLEVPDDVLRFMEFIINHYENVEDVFAIIDGNDGNGEINLQEMKEGLKKMKFRKFEGKDEHDRILSVFRYLDPGGEGSISKQEWNILNQLWREFDLSVREFVHFMVIAFGEDLDSCWEVIDPMDTGTVNLEQWMSAVEDIGFTGPAEIIYALLDSSDDGDISYNEFSKLWDYMPKGEASDSDSDESDHIVRGTDSISVALRGRNSQPIPGGNR